MTPLPFRPAVLLPLAFAGVSAAAATFSVGPDDDCLFRDLAGAVAAAHETPEADLIKLAAITFYPTATAAMHAGGGDLTIEGGYGTCASNVSLFDSTIDGSFMPAPGGLLIEQNSGNDRLDLRWLNLRNSNGGAIRSVASAALALEHVQIHDNSADAGAGVFLSGNSVVRSQLHIADTSIHGNVAKTGGGLYLSNADVVIRGNFQLRLNRAVNAGSGDGGGIWAQDVYIDAAVHGASSLLRDNHAERFGGAVYYVRTSVQYSNRLRLRTDDGQPLEISYNGAGNAGGAFSLAASVNAPEGTFASHGIFNAHISDNEAPFGAAIELFADAHDSGHHLTHSVLLARTEHGDGPYPPCAPDRRCNVIERNGVANGSSSVLYASDQRGGSAMLWLERARVVENRAEVLIDGPISVFASLLASNALRDGLIWVSADAIELRSTTIAANTLAPDMPVIRGVSSSLYLDNGIVDQAGNDVCDMPSSTEVTVSNLLITPATNAGACGAGSNIQYGFPSFVDPAQGDFRLQFNSQARDRSDLAPALDLDGALRPYAPTPTATPYDFGAYEYGAVIDHLFADGFDRP